MGGEFSWTANVHGRGIFIGGEYLWTRSVHGQ